MIARMSASSDATARPARQPLVAVCGTSDASEHEYAAAYEVGGLLAQAGAIVTCGGLAGVMEGAARGAHDSGGMSLGFLPSSDPRAVNDFVTIPIATGLGELRNGLIVNSCHAAIFIGAGYGTLNELALALRRFTVPVAHLKSWEIRAPGSSTPDTTAYAAQTPVDAVNWILQRLSETATSDDGS